LNTNKINIPNELKNAIEVFTTFYDGNYKKRILRWSYPHSMIEIDGRIGNKTYTFICNTLQGVILIAFNQCKSQSIYELMSHTGITDEADFKSAINPLIASKILVKMTDSNLGSGNSNAQEIIGINHKFAFANRRVKITNIPRNEEVIRKDKIEEDRTWAIDATIIRNMKATQKIHHNDLIKRVLEQLDKFKIQIQVKL
jgi:cullin 1